MRRVVLDLNPFGQRELLIRGAIVYGSPRVYAEVLSVLTIPPVSTTVKQAREFAEAIIATCDSLERAERT